jgi:hypothetical protein
MTLPVVLLPPSRDLPSRIEQVLEATDGTHRFPKVRKLSNTSSSELQVAHCALHVGVHQPLLDDPQIDSRPKIIA